jgi:beta-galactosidase/beta-glucuronidase
MKERSNVSKEVKYLSAKRKNAPSILIETIERN